MLSARIAAVALFASATVATSTALAAEPEPPAPDPLKVAVCYEYDGDTVIAGRFGVVPAVGSLVGPAGSIRHDAAAVPFADGEYAAAAAYTVPTRHGDGVRYWSERYEGTSGKVRWIVGEEKTRKRTINFAYDPATRNGKRRECPPPPPSSSPPPSPSPDGCAADLADGTIVDEDFASIDEWADLSELVSWGANTTATSAWDVSSGALRLSETADGFTGYNAADSLKTATALDCRFAAPISHRDHVVEISFRGRWDELDRGEASRIVVALNHDYPTDGIDPALDAAIGDFSQQAFGRPAYHLRIRGGAMGATGTTSTSMLQYGGGATDLGEYERFAGANGAWWLPGFISGAGGVAPGTAADFPANSWVRTSAGVTSTDWVDYRYVVAPDAQRLYVNGDLAAEMPLPEVSDAPLYRYFERFEGIRLYWRSTTGGATIDDLRVTVNPA